MIFLYDEISSGLLIAEIKRNRQELLESLTLYYRIFIMGGGHVSAFGGRIGYRLLWQKEEV